MRPFECSLRVRYAETDQMGVVYHARLLPYFEVGRTEFLRAVGPPYRDLETQGVFLAVVEASLKYLSPIRYDALLTVRTRLDALGRASLAFSYEIADAAGSRLHATGATRHACLDREGRVRPFPEDLRARLAGRLAPAG